MAVKELIKEIKTGLDQASASAKDEVKVMREMLNDRSYKVGVYGKSGLEGEYCPAEDARAMVSSVLNSAAKISKEEAAKIADNYEFKKAEAQTFINVGKEFVNTYLSSGRKLPLGGRQHSNGALLLEHKDASTKTYPKKIGVDDNGKAVFEKVAVKVKAHDAIKAKSPCPSWIK